MTRWRTFTFSSFVQDVYEMQALISSSNAVIICDVVMLPPSNNQVSYSFLIILVCDNPQLIFVLLNIYHRKIKTKPRFTGKDAIGMCVLQISRSVCRVLLEFNVYLRWYTNVRLSKPSVPGRNPCFTKLSRKYSVCTNSTSNSKNCCGFFFI